MLVLVDCVSRTPAGTFFVVFGLSLGINDPAVAQYVGFGRQLLTGTVAGNVYGQASIFWRRMALNSYKRE
jgi:hypothetical protein